MTSSPSAIGELRAGASFLWGLPSFLSDRLELSQAMPLLETQLAARERTFAQVLQRAVFENPASPYRRLMEWAGITFGDVSQLLARDGLDATLEKLADAGVTITLEEFKGRQPIRRRGFEIHARAEDFDNPLTARRYEARTGGSTSAPRRILVDLDLLAHESAYHALFYSAAGAGDRDLAIWQPAPPGAVGIKTALMQAKIGRPTAKWFSQNRPGAVSFKHALFTRAMVLTANLRGARIPFPEYAPATDAHRVAAWLAVRRANGRPAILVTPASAGVRTCRAALDRGLDISGTLFILGGEPYTPAKAAVLAECQSLGFCHYAMVEAGMIGLACQSPAAPDDVHLVSDKIATIQRDRRLGAADTTVRALFHTTLLPASPKVMLNVESGDYGVRVDRDCGCGVLPRAFRSHLHTIRSYEKLTSEGMNFLGDDLLKLVEEVLPARFGGHPTDYQFVEHEEEGLPRVSLLVSDSVGNLDEDGVVETVLSFFRDRGVGEAMMAELWAQSRTLSVVRRSPHVTAGGKILPLQGRGKEIGN